ncbi:hypothetical protein EJ04DRAFT_436212, partial [Polyplosphaeria fusca]
MPPQASATRTIIPFRRNVDFIDHERILQQIHQRCSSLGSRTALVGLGGVGKTQLAIEYAYRVRDESRATWVFWVHASNMARLEQGFRDIADAVELAGRKEPQANVFRLVHDWLRDESKGGWLLVLDSADDAAVFLPVSRYLPPSRHGAVLITSRTERAALCLVEDSDVILIKPMQNGDAQALLHKQLGDDVEQDGTAELAAELEHMPLTLVQAAAYIQKRTPRCSVRQYLDELRQNDERKTSLVNYKTGSLHWDQEARNSIIRTWQISFDHIKKMQESAANLLLLMSFFDRQGIPEILLHDYEKRLEGRNSLRSSEESRENDQDNGVYEVSKLTFEDDIVMLREYSFISPTTTRGAFEMHSLVQVATQRWLKSQGQVERWKQRYIANLCAEFPLGQYENWARCQMLIPHAIAVIDQRPESEESLEEWVLLMYNAAWYTWQRGSAGEAEMSVLSTEVGIRLFSKDDTSTLSSKGMLALANSSKGLWKEMEELEVQVMKTRKRVLGVDHPDTLASMANLALTYRNQNRWEEAEELEGRI